MKQLCYVSFLKDGLDAHEVIDSIKEVAERKNSQYNLTGRLVYSSKIFIQLLEGEEINVDICYRIITEDFRHFGHQVLFEQSPAERAYPDWTMKYEFSQEIDLVVVNQALAVAKSLKGREFIDNEEINKLFKNLLGT